jgi:hypothetical protein
LPGELLEVRWVNNTHPMWRRALPASDIPAAVSLIERLATTSEVYLGVALRHGGRGGGKAAIRGSRFVFIESDHPDTQTRLGSFPYPPSIIVASGTPGHLHLYWQLHRLAPHAEVESANRRLARLLGGDPACVDVARVLRPPATLNHKHTPPAPVLLQSNDPHVYELTELTDVLPQDPDPPSTPASTTARRAATGALQCSLLVIPGAEYARALVGRTPNRDGKILCPFHPERSPSLHLYPDGGFYCFGSGCERGGTIFDFAGYLWRIEPRGDGFLEILSRLAQVFNLRGAA